ncbi:MAG TPA: response regulator [Chitinophagaceae bacterium]|jgi:DNA-binding response OmpR family regulator
MTNTTAGTKVAQKILIIEDEGEMCLVLNILLSNEDIELEHVKKLSAAVEYLKENHPPLIILDNKLPDGYGVDFISFLKRNYPGIKIIMITGYDGSVKDMALENGADSFLEKPFTKQQLFETVRALLKEE